MRKLRMLAAGAALALLVSACQPGGSDSPSPSSGTPSTPAELPTVSSAPPTSMKRLWWRRSTRRRSRPPASPSSATCTPARARPPCPALESGDLNLMPEYIGNFLSVGLRGHRERGRRRDVRRAARRAGRRRAHRARLRPRDGQDAFAVTSETATEFDLATVSDLAPIAADLTWGLPPNARRDPRAGSG